MSEIKEQRIICELEFLKIFFEKFRNTPRSFDSLKTDQKWLALYESLYESHLCLDSDTSGSIIAMPAVTNKGVSKIAPILTPGAGVVTTRQHIHWFVTEYGAVNLYGKSLQERAKLMISIAHPDAREELDKAAFERFGSHFHFVAK